MERFQLLEEIDVLISQTKYKKASQLIEEIKLNTFEPIIKDILVVLEMKLNRTWKFDLKNKLVDDFLINFKSHNLTEWYGQAVVEYLYPRVFKGELDDSLIILNENSDLLNTIKNKETSSTILNLYGIINGFKGNFDKALHYYQLSFQLRQQLPINKLMIESLYNIGENYFFQGNYEKAEEALSLSLASIKEGISFSTQIYILHAYFDLCLKLGDLNKANDIHNQIELLLEEFPEFDRIKLIHVLTKALLLKNSSRMKDKMVAQELLAGIDLNEINDNQLKLKVLKNLCELLLIELKSTGDNAVLMEILDAVGELNATANLMNSNRAIVESLLLQAKLMLIQGNLVVAQTIYEEVVEICTHTDLGELGIVADDDFENFKKQVISWQEMIDSNSSIFDRIEKTKIMNYINWVSDISNQ